MTTFIQGLGIYMPGQKVSNTQLASKFGINAEWIQVYLKNNTRYFATNLETGIEDYDLKTIALNAVNQALLQANIPAEKIDFIIMATATPDKLMPATVNELAFDLGLFNIPTFQLQSGCSGAIQAIYLANELLSQPKFQYGLVIGADTCNKFIDPLKDYTESKASEIINYALFGDGAGALVLSSNKNNNNLQITDVHYELLKTDYLPGQIVNWQGIKAQKDELLNEDYKAIETHVPLISHQELSHLLEISALQIDAVNWFLMPQLSGMMTEKIIDFLQLDNDKTINCVANTGNNGNALLFFQLSDLLEHIQAGENAIAITVESSRWLTGGMVIQHVGATSNE